MSETEALLAFGQRTIVAAGRIAAQRFRAAGKVVNKQPEQGWDPVTEADRAVEKCIRERINARYPQHGIVGEEFGAERGASSWSWIIDPIDGTRAFITGLPAWGCLLGLLRDGEPAAGFMHQPVVGETFCGDGERAWVRRGGERRFIRARAAAGLAEAIVCATHPSMFGAAALARFEALAARARLMRYGGDCYNYCLLAHGLVDLVVEDGLRAYDILPLVPIVRGAGGCVTDVAGATPRDGGLVVAAGNARLHAIGLEAMGSAPIADAVP